MNNINHLTPTSQVEVSVSCRNLSQRDVISKCDPTCILFQREHATEEWIQIDQTEITKWTSNPNFTHKFILNYHFNKTQHLRFDVYDCEKKSENLMGRFEILLSSLIRRKRYEDKMVLCNNKNSTIQLTCLEFEECKESVTLQFTGKDLDKKDIFGKSDPYLQIYRSEEEDITIQSAKQCKEWTLVYQTEVVKNNLNPQWKSFSRLVPQIFGSEKKKVLKFECYDWDIIGKHDLIGKFYTTLAQLQCAFEDSTKNRFYLIHPIKETKHGGTYTNSGIIMITKCFLKQEYSFIDYMQEGACEFNFSVAIDFSSPSIEKVATQSIESDENVNFCGSEFEVAIQMISKILGLYKFDSGAINGYGFGAGVSVHSPTSSNSDPFPLSLTQGDMLNGCGDLLAAYQNALSIVKPYNSAQFVPIIRRVSQAIASHAKGAKYFVLIILTNGLIVDVEETKRSLHVASCLPLSIIIIGLGDGDFTSMRLLDGYKINDESDVMSKDIVKFVALRDFLSERNPMSLKSQSDFVHEALDELPQQVCQWMSSHNIAPVQPKLETTSNHDVTTNLETIVLTADERIAPCAPPRVPPRPTNYTAPK